MKKLRFVVSLHTRENDFHLAQAQTAEETAHKLGSDVEIVFADNDAVNQSTQLLKAIQSRVESRPDAIVVEPFGGTALPQVARAASAAALIASNTAPVLQSAHSPCRASRTTAWNSHCRRKFGCSRTLIRNGFAFQLSLLRIEGLCDQSLVLQIEQVALRSAKRCSFESSDPA
jgi:hypothetical protein